MVAISYGGKFQNETASGQQQEATTVGFYFELKIAEITDFSMLPTSYYGKVETKTFNEMQ